MVLKQPKFLITPRKRTKKEIEKAKINGKIMDYFITEKEFQQIVNICMLMAFEYKRNPYGLIVVHWDKKKNV